MEPNSFIEGQIILIDKPLNWTSFDVVGKIRNRLRRYCNVRKIKVGHAGTLDPLATGLLILCTGKMTKSIESYQSQTKEYTGKIKLGATTPSYDLESEIDRTFETSHITKKMIEEVTQSFLGEQNQVPPIFSAKKVDGVRSYEKARKGDTVVLKPNKIAIHHLQLTPIDEQTLEFVVSCSKGTYIRSLAHDIGQNLNSGGHLIELRRTKIGDFSVDQAQSPEQFLSTLQTSE